MTTLPGDGPRRATMSAWRCPRCGCSRAEAEAGALCLPNATARFEAGAAGRCVVTRVFADRLLRDPTGSLLRRFFAASRRPLLPEFDLFPDLPDVLGDQPSGEIGFGEREPPPEPEEDEADRLLRLIRLGSLP